ncbi:hypothetical protein VTJ83DRAFT_1969 [Remersonia thermophila]|uniref:Mucin n=1 Tax=Remersonia thermophila TaxID=72144 RepID=A0ABR4DHF8_9PEZI
MAGSSSFDAHPGYRFDHLAQDDARDSSSTPSSSQGVAAASARLLRPGSAGSGSERTASPLAFARWARRHRHHHSNGHNRYARDDPQEYGPADETSRERARRTNPKRLRRSRSVSAQERPQAPVVPQMTLEEFEALPLAVRKKFFSTLERLRFAQESALVVDGISQHYDEISNLKCRKPRPGRTALGHPPSRVRRDSASELRSVTTASLWSFEPSEATESVTATYHSQLASTALGPVDDDLRLGSRPSRRDLSAQFEPLTPPLSPARHSMDARVNYGPRQGSAEDGQFSESFFESFRWLDEEEDLDLRLFLDDYHANLREGAVAAAKQRPSFRRNMSINRKPFGRRNSVSSMAPKTKETAQPPSQSDAPTAGVSGGPAHTRRKSRGLSLITPKHAPQPSITAIDPAAAHYQDPEARMKLRMYLASPQKFDEAVAFGFPSAASADELYAEARFSEDTAGRSRGPSKQKSADGVSTGGTFLADKDDDVSLYSDGQSMADPDSPKTPESTENRTGVPRHTRYASAPVLNSRDAGRKTPEGLYAVQAPTAGREMTLRMTLTRPDLRAHEDEIYGWQQKQAYYQHTRRPTALASLASESRALGTDSHRPSVDRFSDMDHWNDGPAEKGVMRRIWNRVRRG